MAFAALLTSRLSLAIRSQSPAVGSSWPRVNLFPAWQGCESQSFSSQNKGKGEHEQSAQPQLKPDSGVEAASSGADKPTRAELLNSQGIFAPFKELLQDLNGRIWSHVVSTQFETSFQEQEFLEGCRDAYFMVHSLVGEESWDSLSEMVSPLMLSAFRGAQEEYKAKHLHMAFHPPEEIEARIVMAGAPRYREISRYFRQRPEQAGSSQPEPSQQAEAAPGEASGDVQDRRWLVVLVQMRSALESRISNAQGQLQHVAVDHRAHKWKFGRQLPESWRLGSPLRLLEAPWTLLSIE